MRTWTATTTAAAHPEAVLDVLTDPDASVSVRSGGGLTGRILAEATGALLTAGALQAALGRIAREASLTYA